MKNKETIILGIDPGTAITGWGIIKDGKKEMKVIAMDED